MKTYEITYLTVNEENHNASAVSDILAANGAKISAVHLWGGRRKLTYPIKKQDQAFFTTVVFEAEPSAIQPIEKALSLKDDVLRALVVIYQPGFFERAAAAPTEEKSESKPTEEKAPEVVTPAVEEAPAETPAAEETTTEATEAPAEEEKPKRTRAKKTEEETKELDTKIDELLNEDLTK